MTDTIELWCLVCSRRMIKSFLFVLVLPLDFFLLSFPVQEKVPVELE